MRKTMVGIMGGCDAEENTIAVAYNMGRLIAEHGWALVSGGRPHGVMQASVSGAKEAGGFTVGVLYGDDIDDAAKGLDIVIPTGMGAGRNVINILSSDVVVACKGTGGTLSEIALALRFGRPVVLVDFDPGETFLKACAADARFSLVATPEQAIAQVGVYLKEMGRG
jgi:uncharacterized protein (TIGR00725 family)